jgi:zinc protease
VVILVTGDIDPARTLALVKKEYGSWKTGYTAPKVPIEPDAALAAPIDVPSRARRSRRRAQLQGEAYQPDDRTYVAAMLAASSRSARPRGCTRSSSSTSSASKSLFVGFDETRDPGLWSVSARVKEAADVAGDRAGDVGRGRGAAQGRRSTRSASTRCARTCATASSRSLSTAAQDGAARSRSYVALTGDVACVNPFFATLAAVTPRTCRRPRTRGSCPEHSTVAILHTKGVEVPLAAAKNASAPAKNEAPEPEPTQPEPTVAAEPAASSAAAPAGRIVQAPVLLPVESDPEISFKIWFQVGSQDDPAGKEGLAALTAEMISDGGSERLPYDKILEQLFPLAASYSASVDKEMTVVSGSVHKDNVEKYTDLLVDAITRPGFRKDDFERLRDQAVSGIENVLRFSSDEELGKATLYERVFAGTPYGHLDSGTVASLKSITLEDVKAFHKAHYTRDNVVIGLGGGYAKSLPEKLAASSGDCPRASPTGPPRRRPRRSRAGA